MSNFKCPMKRKEIIYFPTRSQDFLPRSVFPRLEILESSEEMDFSRGGPQSFQTVPEIFKICIISVWDSNSVVLGRKSGSSVGNRLRFPASEVGNVLLVRKSEHFLAR
jgi:hypothetical protein